MSIKVMCRVGREVNVRMMVTVSLVNVNDRVEGESAPV